MSITAGTFSCANLAAIHKSIQLAWQDSAVAKSLVINSDAAQAFVAQNANIELMELQDTQLNNTVKVFWADFCDTDTAAAGTVCSTRTGVKSGADCKDYTLGISREKSFAVVLDINGRAHNVSPEMQYEVAFKKTMKTLDEYFTKQLITKLDTYIGTPAAAPAGTTLDTDTIYVPAQMWNADLFMKLTLFAKKEGMQMPWLLTGENLWLPYQNAGFNQIDSTGKVKMATIPTYFDVFNVEEVSEKTTYLIDKGAVAFVSKNYYPEVAIEQIGSGFAHELFSVPSLSIPGFRYDVIKKRTCVDSTVVETFTMVGRCDLLQNPLGCDADKTGVYKFVCGDVPA